MKTLLVEVDMKARVDENGWYHIERGGMMIRQMCPYRKNEECGDTCPMFFAYNGTSGCGEINLCKGTYTFDSLIIEARR